MGFPPAIPLDAPGEERISAIFSPGSVRLLRRAAGLPERFGLTADAQYMFDGLRTGGGPRGVILGLRATIEY
jgi:hypothetical protein